MPTQIFIPTPLRAYTDNRASIEVEAADVAGALYALAETYPAVGPHLFNSCGTLRSFVNVYLNDNDIRYLSDEQTVLAERDVISIIPAIAGGVDA